jgi:hypothetical protein
LEWNPSRRISKLEVSMQSLRVLSFLERIQEEHERCAYRPPLLLVAAALAGGIFLIDTLTSLQFAVASLYVIVGRLE